MAKADAKHSDDSKGEDKPEGVAKAAPKRASRKGKRKPAASTAAKKKRAPKGKKTAKAT